MKYLIPIFFLFTIACAGDYPRYPSSALAVTLLDTSNSTDGSSSSSSALTMLSSIPGSTSVLMQDQNIQVIFNQSLETGSCTTSPGTPSLDTVGTLSYTTTYKTNDTLVITPNAGSWTTGSNKNLIVSGCRASGLTAQSVSLNYFVANPSRSFYVNATTGSDLYAGTSASPFQTLGQANTVLAALGTSCSIQPDCSVQVTAGTYTMTAGPFMPLNGVGYFGSYDSSFSSRYPLNSSYYSTIVDNHATGGGTQASPSRAVEFTASVTSATTFSGFYVLGRSGVSYSAGMLITNGSPIILQNLIEGGQGTNSSGMHILAGNAMIVFNIITPYRSAALNLAYGLTNNSTGTPTIQSNYIYSGNATNVNYGIIHMNGTGKYLNNIIYSGSSLNSYGFYIQFNGGKFFHNSLLLGTYTTNNVTAIAFGVNANSMNIDNNIIYVAGSATTRTCFSETVVGGPATFRNNVLYGCPNLYYDFDLAMNLTAICTGGTLGDVTCTTLLATPATTFADNNLNINPQYTSTVLSSINLKLQSTTPCSISRGAYNNGITEDFEFKPRPGTDSYYSIGAYEYDGTCQ